MNYAIIYYWHYLSAAWVVCIFRSGGLHLASSPKWSPYPQHTGTILARLILRPYIKSFLRTEARNCSFFSGLFPDHFLYRFCVEVWTPGLLKPGSRMGSFAKNKFSQRSFYLNLRFYSCRFSKALGAVLLSFVAVGDRLEN